jgi:hypothetical protein
MFLAAPKRGEKNVDLIALNGDLVCADFFVGFEGALVAGEDDDLSLLAKLAQNLNQSFISFIIEVDEYIIQDGGQRF